MNYRYLLRKGDIVLFLALTAVSVAGLLLVRRPVKPAYCEVVAGGTSSLVYLPADTNLEVLGPLGHTDVQVRQHSARVTRSSCPTGFCVRSGAISRCGQVIVCAPNRVVVRLGGRAVDAVTR